MLFQTNNYIGRLSEPKDIENILEVYNSNPHFLINHLGLEQITVDWLSSELDGMKDIGFQSCIIVEKETEQTIGFIDFKADEESYLSLNVT